MKKVLMVAYDFPPVPPSASLRSLKFAKYLPDYHWQPLVLTVRDNPHAMIGPEPSLLNELPSDVEVIQIRSLDPDYLSKKWRMRNISKGIGGIRGLPNYSNPINKLIHQLLIPDIHVLWVITAVPQALSLIWRRSIELIYTTSLPHSTHLIGYLLKKITGKPWIIDIRDAWMSPEHAQNPSIRLGIEKRFQRAMLRTADKILCATKGLEEDFKMLYPDIGTSRFITITNGVDLADYSCAHNKKDNSKFIITYTGALSDKGHQHINPIHLFKALKQLSKEHAEILNKLEFIFVGDFEPRYKEQVGNLLLTDLVKFTGRVPYKKAIEYQLESDVLVLVNVNKPPYGGKFVFTNKLFEYLAAGKPILCLAHECHASELVRRENLGIIVPPDDVVAIKEAIYDMYLRYKKGDLKVKVDSSVLKSFDRRELTKKLAMTFDDLVSKA